MGVGYLNCVAGSALELAVGEGEEEGEGDGEGEPGTEEVFGEEGDGGDGDAGQEDEQMLRPIVRR